MVEHPPLPDLPREGLALALRVAVQQLNERWPNTAAVVNEARRRLLEPDPHAQLGARVVEVLKAYAGAEQKDRSPAGSFGRVQNAARSLGLLEAPTVIGGAS